MNNVSGLTARWADERDGHYQHQRPLQQQAILGSDLSAVNRLQKSLASPSSPSSNSEDPGESPTATTVAVASGPLLTPISRSPLLDLQPQLTPPATVIDQAEQPRSSSADHPPHTDQANQPSDISPIHPYLRRAVLSVYRGRALKEESSSSGERKYVDEAAVFVGRLVKTAETKESLLERFERYGKIVSLFFMPALVTSIESPCSARLNIIHTLFRLHMQLPEFSTRPRMPLNVPSTSRSGVPSLLQPNPS